MPGSGDFAVVIEFASPDDFAHYRAHPAHLASAQLIGELTHGRSAVSISAPD